MTSNDKTTENTSLRIGNDLGLRNVLITRFSSLSDVAMTVPVVYSVCATYPEVRFIMVTRPSMTGIFVNSPVNLTVVGADIKGEYSGLRGLYRLTHDLCTKYDIDAFVDLHDVLRTKAMRFFAWWRRIPIAALDKGRGSKRALTRRTGKVMLPLSSSRARYREAFFKVGLPVQDSFQGLYGRGGKGDPALFATITAPKRAEEKWIGIAPFAAHPGKVYPAEKMTEVISSICQRFPDCRIFLFGSDGHEAETADRWAAMFPQVTSLCGKHYGFGVELALLSHLDVVLTMDSANMHLAAIAGTRTISVWGATHPYCGFKGWHQRDSDTVQLPLTCRPCSVFGEKPCYRNDMLCLQAIRPETIVAKLTAVLEPENI